MGLGGLAPQPHNTPLLSMNKMPLANCSPGYTWPAWCACCPLICCDASHHGGFTGKRRGAWLEGLRPGAEGGMEPASVLHPAAIISQRERQKNAVVELLPGA